MVKGDKTKERLQEINDGEEGWQTNWIFLQKQKNIHKNNCLCGHDDLIHQFYYNNIKTNKIVCMGASCRKYIHFGKTKKYKKGDNKKIDDIIECDILASEFTNIGDFDLEAHCNNNFNIMFGHFKHKILNLQTYQECMDYAIYLSNDWGFMNGLPEIKGFLDNHRINLSNIKRQKQRLEELQNKNKSPTKINEYFNKL
tara:strand:+ start:457 stop:1050 length:594 start_codon:yes stop_codon:yes gene_type:complete